MISKYSLVPELNWDDERLSKFYDQTIKRGFDDTELWNLDVTIIKFILPRLKRFRKITISHPGQLTAKKWDKILKKIIVGFKLYIKESDGKIIGTDKQYKKIDKSLKLFFKYFRNLWD